MKEQLAPAPPGFRWVVNRLDADYAIYFDGIPYEFDPHEYKLLTDAAAEFMAEKSIVKEDPFNPARNVFAIGIEGTPEFTSTISQADLGIERLDRTYGDYVVAPKEAGQPDSKLTVIPLTGTRGTKDVLLEKQPVRLSGGIPRRSQPTEKPA